MVSGVFCRRVIGRTVVAVLPEQDQTRLKLPSIHLEYCRDETYMKSTHVGIYNTPRDWLKKMKNTHRQVIQYFRFNL